MRQCPAGRPARQRRLRGTTTGTRALAGRGGSAGLRHIPERVPLPAASGEGQKHRAPRRTAVPKQACTTLHAGAAMHAFPGGTGPWARPTRSTCHRHRAGWGGAVLAAVALACAGRMGRWRRGRLSPGSSGRRSVHRVRLKRVHLSLHALAKHPTPHQEEVLWRLQGCNQWSRVALRAARWQAPAAARLPAPCCTHPTACA